MIVKMKGKHLQERKTHDFKNIIAVCLLLSAIVGITYSKYTNEIEQETFNIEFIAGNIKLDITDSSTEYVIVPGKVITKESKITVKEKSEECFLFIELEKSNDFETLIEYEISSEWTNMGEETDIYYCKVAKTTEDTDYSIFKDNQIVVKKTATKQNYEDLSGINLTLNAKAYAVQKNEEISTAEEAWNLIKNNEENV